MIVWKLLEFHSSKFETARTKPVSTFCQNLEFLSVKLTEKKKVKVEFLIEMYGKRKKMSIQNIL